MCELVVKVLICMIYASCYLGIPIASGFCVWLWWNPNHSCKGRHPHQSRSIYIVCVIFVHLSISTLIHVPPFALLTLCSNPAASPEWNVHACRVLLGALRCSIRFLHAVLALRNLCPPISLSLYSCTNTTPVPCLSSPLSFIKSRPGMSTPCIYSYALRLPCLTAIYLANHIPSYTHVR